MKLQHNYSTITGEATDELAAEKAEKGVKDEPREFSASKAKRTRAQPRQAEAVRAAERHKVEVAAENGSLPRSDSHAD